MSSGVPGFLRASVASFARPSMSTVDIQQRLCFYAQVFGALDTNPIQPPLTNLNSQQLECFVCMAWATEDISRPAVCPPFTPANDVSVEGETLSWGGSALSLNWFGLWSILCLHKTSRSWLDGAMRVRVSLARSPILWTSVTFDNHIPCCTHNHAHTWSMVK